MPPFKIVETKFVDQTLTVVDGLHAAGDNVGGLLTLNMHSVGGAGRITQISLYDDDNLKSQMDIYIFHEEPTAGDFDDDDAFAPTMADRLKEIRKLTIGAGLYDEVNSNSVAHLPDLTIDYKLEKGGKLYFNLVTPGGVTPTSTSGYTLRVYYLAN